MKKIIVPSVYDSSAEERPIYSAWLKHSNERDMLEKVLDEKFDDWYVRNPLSMLEWGCGLGSAAQRFMSVLNRRGAEYNYTGVDPFLDQLARFRSVVSGDKRVRLEQGSFDSYVPEKKYDLGIAVHSLYYADFEPVLAKIAEFSDKMFLVHHGEQGINQVHLSFPELIIGRANEVSTHKDVCAVLDHLQISYDVQVYTSEVNVEPCHDPQNSDGRDLIKFFLDNKDLTEAEIERVSLYFRKLGSTMMEHDFVIISS